MSPGMLGRLAVNGKMLETVREQLRGTARHAFEELMVAGAANCYLRGNQCKLSPKGFREERDKEFVEWADKARRRILNCYGVPQFSTFHSNKFSQRNPLKWWVWEMAEHGLIKLHLKNIAERLGYRISKFDGEAFIHIATHKDGADDWFDLFSYQYLRRYGAIDAMFMPVHGRKLLRIDMSDLPLFALDYILGTVQGGNIENVRCTVDIATGFGAPLEQARWIVAFIATGLGTNEVYELVNWATPRPDRANGTGVPSVTKQMIRDIKKDIEQRLPNFSVFLEDPAVLYLMKMYRKTRSQLYADFKYTQAMKNREHGFVAHVQQNSSCGRWYATSELNIRSKWVPAIQGNTLICVSPPHDSSAPNPPDPAEIEDLMVNLPDMRKFRRITGRIVTGDAFRGWVPANSYFLDYAHSLFVKAMRGLGFDTRREVACGSWELLVDAPEGDTGIKSAIESRVSDVLREHLDGVSYVPEVTDNIQCW